MNRPSRPEGLADGQPLVELVAVIDETVPQVGAGVHYVLTTAVMLSPITVVEALAGLFTDTPGRLRPFHWHKEGPEARDRITDIVVAHGVIAHSRYQTVGRRGQLTARQLLLDELASDLHHEQVDHLVIESVDDLTNRRDKRTLLDHFEPIGGVPFAYDWRSKSARILWIADAINGALHDYMVQGDTTWLTRAPGRRRDRRRASLQQLRNAKVPAPVLVGCLSAALGLALRDLRLRHGVTP